MRRAGRPSSFFPMRTASPWASPVAPVASYALAAARRTWPPGYCPSSALRFCHPAAPAPGPRRLAVGPTTVAVGIHGDTGGGTGLLYGVGARGSCCCFISYLRQVTFSTVEAAGKAAAATSLVQGRPSLSFFLSPSCSLPSNYSSVFSSAISF